MADDSAGRRRLSPNLIAAAVLVALAIAVVAWQQPWKTSSTPTKATIGSDAGRVIAAQFRSLEYAGTRAEFVAAAGGDKVAGDWAGETYANLALLDVTDVGMRFLRGGQNDLRRDGNTEATVEVSWKPGADSGLTPVRTTQVKVTFILDPGADGSFAIRGAERGDGPLPLWLAGRLGLDQRDDVSVITIDGGDADKPIGQYATEAQQSVRAILPDAKRRLLVISPHTQAQAAAVLDQSAAAVEQIAAVTTTLDGSDKAGGLVVLNPAVFDTMDQRAAQVVMSHEATHLMTGAVGIGIEPWVAEGFADFVALREDTAPLSVSAGQILRKVGDDATPKNLPNAGDFGSAQHGLGATYESAWMIFRMLGARFDDKKIVDFYEVVLGGTTVEKAVQGSFDLTVAELTRDWRAYLEKSASIGS